MPENRLNVLLVDDDAAMGVYLVPDVLEGSGHAMVWMDSAPRALDYIVAAGAGRAACDAVILDFRLSETDADAAHAVLAGIREHLGNDFPVIGFSTARMEDMGITGLYADPGKEGVFDLPVLLDGLAVHLSHRAKQQV